MKIVSSCYFQVNEKVVGEMLKHPHALNIRPAYLPDVVLR